MCSRRVFVPDRGAADIARAHRARRHVLPALTTVVTR
jgi:hypothetical protein